MKEDCSINRHYRLMGFLALGVVLPMSANAKTSTTCAPVYQQCVVGEACGTLAIGSEQRAACFSACGAEEAQCRDSAVTPASVSTQDRIPPSAAPSAEPNQSE